VTAFDAFRGLVRDRTKPAAEQIVSGVMALITSAQLQPGARLPPIRALAALLGVNRNTVAKAYQELAERGFVRSRFGGGSVVARPPARPVAAAAPANGNGQARGTGQTRFSEQDWTRRFAQHLSVMEQGQAGALNLEQDPINLFQLRPHTALFPSELFRKCLNAVLRRQPGALLNYGAPAGYLPLREAIAARLQAQGITAGAGEILITSGSQQGIDLVARALLDPGDGVVVESPMYSIARKIFLVNGARLLPYALSPEGLDLGALERAPGRPAKLFYAVPNFQNPTTYTYTAEERAALLALAYQAGSVVMEDASGQELHGDAAAFPALAALDASGRVIHLNTFSKTLIPAVRVGYLAGAAPVVRKLTELKEMTDLSHSLIMQAATAEFMERGHFDAHVARMRGFYWGRIALAADMLAAALPPEVTFSDPRGGLCIWVDLPAALDADVAARRLADRGVLVSPAGLYQPLQGGRNGFRLCVSFESEARLARGIGIIGEELGRLLRRRPAVAVSREYQAMH
jgi:GntR family transcriptional regulator/MocR family aminotransferase